MSGKRIKRRHAAPEWLKLDNAGKIYPATRSFGWMAVYRLSVTLDEPVDETLLNQALKTTVKRLPIFPGPPLNRPRNHEPTELASSWAVSALLGRKRTP